MSEIADAIRALDQKSWGAVEDAREALVPLGAAIFPEALEIYPTLKRYQGRTALVYTAVKFSRVSKDARALGRMALGDKSKGVRYRACALLAVSGDRGALPDLEALLQHDDPETRADARAAIKAIETQNRHAFPDRAGTGKVRFEIGGLIDP